jgi:hypothetical protein
MSIRTRIREVLNKELFCLAPADGGECVRTLFVSDEVLRSVTAPFPETFYGHRLGQFRGTLDTFTRGSWVSIAEHPYTKKPSAYFAPVDPIAFDIWDIRSLAPDPQIRCFGGWAEKDTFIALTWSYRDDIKEFSTEAKECRKEWDRIFGPLPPYRGESIHDYIKQRFRVV